MLKTTQWIPVLIPKQVVKQLLKEYTIPIKETSYMGILKRLQDKVKTIKLFKGMSEQQIIKKLHQERKKLLKENPHAYINYSA